MAQIRCKKCRETAARGCKLGLCATCCWPRCAENVHANRTVARGCEGKPRRRVTRFTWQEAERVASEFLEESRLRNSSALCNMSLEKARVEIFHGLILLSRNPGIDVSDPRIPFILPAALSPADIGRIIDQLVSLRSGSTEYSGGQASSSWETTEVPWVSDAAAPVSHSEEPRHEVPVEPEVPEAPKDTVTSDSDKESVTSSDVPWDDFRCHLEAVPQCKPGNQPALDATNKPVSHYTRKTPPSVDLWKWAGKQIPPTQPFPWSQLGKVLLQRWIDLRPELQRRLLPMYTKPFCFFESDGRENRSVLELHDVGCWFWFDLKVWQPPPPPSVDMSRRPTLGKYEFEEAVHCCSMYTLMSAVLNGLQPGPEAGKGQKRGVYAYRTVSSMKLALSSSGYCVYDKISEDDIFLVSGFCWKYRHGEQEKRASET